MDLIDQENLEQLEKSKARLGEFRRLRRGWHDGEGELISPQALHMAESFLAKRPPPTEGYGIFPTLAGGVLVEFQTDIWDLSLEFGGAGEVELFGVEINGASEYASPAYKSLDDGFLADFDRLAGNAARR